MQNQQGLTEEGGSRGPDPPAPFFLTRPSLANF